MNFETIRYEVETGVATITFARPEKLNTLNPTVWHEIIAALDLVEADNDVCSVLLKGEGRAFCAGFDLEASADQKEDMWGQWQEIRKESQHNQRVWNCNKPIVAAVQGYCMGSGLDLVNLVDFVVCSEDAKFGETEMRYSFLPQPSMLWLIGSRRAKEVLLLADRFDAQEAYRLGLVTKVVPLDELDDTARKLAQKLANMPTETMQMTKRILNNALDGMGFNQMNEWAWDNMVLSKFMTTKLSAQYDEIEKAEGTKAAMHWLNARFK
ncbi:enoyl-CoA hydratase/isomerase family protein [Chakrabartyella piscis]|uniref:enoyl-CoA hydratase/isomerase family protein n=1 Tax=Chakrabartyella piscis TaxID=2918914 RepID=UPI0029586E6E|nr:enoyl-CoA hydratase/isomerase family protein [Chakrabartyella piscis]